MPSMQHDTNSGGGPFVRGSGGSFSTHRVDVLNEQRRLYFSTDFQGVDEAARYVHSEVVHGLAGDPRRQQPVVGHVWSADRLDDACAICLEDMRDKQWLAKLPCGHYFHSSCIENWLSTACTCPLCKRVAAM